jgi:hypothetical protein
MELNSEILETKAKISNLTIRLANLIARENKYVALFQRNANNSETENNLSDTSPPSLSETSPRKIPIVRTTRKRNNHSL